MLSGLFHNLSGLEIALEAFVVIGAIFMGVRKGGISIGLWGGVGVFVLVFVFGIAPGSPPIDAMLIVLAVISAASAMQAAGGTDYLVMIASKIIRAHPKQITWVAPIVSFFFTVGAGTGNIWFALLPVIYEVSYANGIRPEKPLAASSTASQMAIICSPVSAAMAAMITLVGTGSTYFQKGTVPMGLQSILLIVFPACLIGVIALSTVQNFIGKPLDKDPEYQRRLKAGMIEPPKPLHNLDKEEQAKILKGRTPAFIFLAGVLVIVLFALIPSLRPSFTIDGSTGPLSMNTTIELVMMTVAVIILMVGRVHPEEVLKQGTWSAGLTSMVALFGIAWLADTFISTNIDVINSGLGSLVKAAPWAIAVALFLVAALTTSQSSTTRSIIPIGLSLGLAPWLLVAMWPSVIGIYAFPANGSQIAAVEMDRTGSTKISKFILWHSFTIPMLVGWVVSVIVGIAIGYFAFGMGH